VGCALCLVRWYAAHLLSLRAAATAACHFLARARSGALHSRAPVGDLHACVCWRPWAHRSNGRNISVRKTAELFELVHSIFRLRGPARRAMAQVRRRDTELRDDLRDALQTPAALHFCRMRARLPHLEVLPGNALVLGGASRCLRLSAAFA